MFMKGVLIACCPMPFSTIVGAKHLIRLVKPKSSQDMLCQARVTVCLVLKVTVYTEII